MVLGVPSRIRSSWHSRPSPGQELGWVPDTSRYRTISTAV
jgi:hypothetical protein